MVAVGAQIYLRLERFDMSSPHLARAVVLSIGRRRQTASVAHESHQIADHWVIREGVPLGRLVEATWPDAAPRHEKGEG